jgi:membrane fusion protein, copper/silver efflux system
MKRALNGSRYAFLVLMVLLLSFCKNSSQKEDGGSTGRYTCPMHPQIVSDTPGTCPICQMDLVPVHSKAEAHGIDTGLAGIIKPSNQYVLSDIRTVKPSPGVRVGDVAVQGIINYNTNNWHVVSSRVAGRIERLYVKYNYQAVRKGQKLMDIYSPDLASAQQELIYLQRSGDKALIKSAKKKLRLLGASEQQINTTLRTGKADYTFSIYSPYAGYIAEQTFGNEGGTSVSGTAIVAEGSDNGMGGMSNGAQSANPVQVPVVQGNTPLQVREGQYVSQGQKLFSLINASSVWAEFFASPDQLRFFKRGTAVQISSIDKPNQKALSTVSLIQPYYSEGSSFPLLRAGVSNAQGIWKVGQLVEVKTDADSQYGVWLPKTAVLHLGTQYIAFVKRGQNFVPVYVTVGERRGDWVDIGDSLPKDADAAVNAWFMVDSESFVRVEKLNEKGR